MQRKYIYFFRIKISWLNTNRNCVLCQSVWKVSLKSAIEINFNWTSFRIELSWVCARAVLEFLPWSGVPRDWRVSAILGAPLRTPPKSPSQILIKYLEIFTSVCHGFILLFLPEKWEIFSWYSDMEKVALRYTGRRNWGVRVGNGEAWARPPRVCKHARPIPAITAPPNLQLAASAPSFCHLLHRHHSEPICWVHIITRVWGFFSFQIKL